MENRLKCPQCGRELTESELYCYFCEMEVPEQKQKNQAKERKFPNKK